MNDSSNEALLKAGIGVAVLQGLGFEPAPSSSLGNKLRYITPNGGTAMRDSLIQGIQMMLSLYQILAHCGIADHWNFVHIVVTDGDDTSSRSSLEEAAEIMSLIGRTIPPKMLKTWFIGVDIDSSSKAINEIGTLVRRGGENAQFARISANNIDQIFAQLRINLGLIQHTQVRGVRVGNEALIGVRQQDYAVLTVEEQHYVVLFNLDASGSMAGSRWNSLCKCVNEFISNLGPTDLVAGLAFNTQVELLTLSPEARRAIEEAQSKEASKQRCAYIILVLIIMLFCFGIPPMIFCCWNIVNKSKRLTFLSVLSAVCGIYFYIRIFSK